MRQPEPEATETAHPEYPAEPPESPTEETPDSGLGDGWVPA